MPSFSAPVVAVGLMLTVGCMQMGTTSGAPGDDGGDGLPAGQQPLATFDVTTEQQDADCGSGQMVLDDSWTFATRLSRDDEGEHVYWDAGKGPKEGSLAADGVTFAISSTLELDMRTPEDSWRPPCRIRRVDELSAELDRAERPTAFHGRMTFHFEPVGDSDCSDLLVGPERLLQRLPCDASYALDATAQGEGGEGGLGGAGGSGGAGSGGISE